MHSAVNASRNGSRRPPRSESAPRTGDTRALIPTLTMIAMLRTACPVAAPNRASSVSHRPIAPDTTANEKIVFAKSYSAHAPFDRVRRFGSVAAAWSDWIAGAVDADIGERLSLVVGPGLARRARIIGGVDERASGDSVTTLPCTRRRAAEPPDRRTSRIGR